jgi:hypothetical protein
VHMCVHVCVHVCARCTHTCTHDASTPMRAHIRKASSTKPEH